MIVPMGTYCFTRCIAFIVIFIRHSCNSKNIFFKNPTQKTRATHNAYALKRVPHGDAVGEVDPGTQKYPALHCPLQAELDSDVPEP